jgi:DNA-binding NtrC family response regulator
MKPLPLPSDDDLRRLIHFSSHDGRIWLAGHRMILVHSASLGALKRELITSIGYMQTRRILMRAGFTAGEKDAILARQVRSNATIEEMFAVGPQLHMLEGAVQVTPIELELNVDKGMYHGIFQWDNSWEVETHVNSFGPQDKPVCWMLLGYASGYTSSFMRKPVFYKELKCNACGEEHCLIEGRLKEDWPDGDNLAEDFDADPLILQLEELRSKVINLSGHIEKVKQSETLLGNSAKFLQATNLLNKAAGTKVSVLITGETGVGKELFAKTLHNQSSRSNKPFIAVNCAALPTDLIESELFGVEKGAYTGATTSREGRFERANGGTLFLDELCEMPIGAQAKLLRVLQEGYVERLGGNKTIKVDVRVIAATNVDIKLAVDAGHFRQDLYYRLNVYPINIPSLKDRVDDIPQIANHILKRLEKKHEKITSGFSDRAMFFMSKYNWPGNIRELENVIERGVILADQGEVIDAIDLFPQITSTQTSFLNETGNLEQTDNETRDLLTYMLKNNLSLDDISNLLIQESVIKHSGNLAAAARTLGITRPQLSYRLSKQSKLINTRR